MLSQTRIKSMKIGDRNTKDKWPLHKVDKHQFQKTSLKTIILNRVKQNSFRTYLSFAVNESLVSLWKRQYCFEYLLNKNSSHLLKSFSNVLSVFEGWNTISFSEREAEKFQKAKERNKSLSLSLNFIHFLFLIYFFYIRAAEMIFLYIRISQSDDPKGLFCPVVWFSIQTYWWNTSTDLKPLKIIFFSGRFSYRI